MADVISAISSLAWPIIIVCALYFSWYLIVQILRELINKLRLSSDFKFGSIEIKGVVLPAHGEVIKGRRDFEIIPATESDFKDRDSHYRRQGNLMLVHTIRPTDPPDWVGTDRVFDVSIFLHPHKEYGRLNDVKSVTYYLGQYWGSKPYGSKFKIANGNDQFALTATAYGSFLCVAQIEFHNGLDKATIYRYIDTEMAPVYGPATRAPKA